MYEQLSIDRDVARGVPGSQFERRWGIGLSRLAHVRPAERPAKIAEQFPESFHPRTASPDEMGSARIGGEAASINESGN